jgi:hypothetical protein
VIVLKMYFVGLKAASTWAAVSVADPFIVT